MTHRACLSCCDGYVWTRDGQTGKECPVCKGKAYLDGTESESDPDDWRDEALENDE